MLDDQSKGGDAGGDAGVNPMYNISLLVSTVLDIEYNDYSSHWIEPAVQKQAKLPAPPPLDLPAIRTKYRHQLGIGVRR